MTYRNANNELFNIISQFVVRVTKVSELRRTVKYCCYLNSDCYYCSAQLLWIFCIVPYSYRLLYVSVTNGYK
jgi:hypothetical protein